MPSAVEARSLNHWAAREVPEVFLPFFFFFLLCSSKLIGAEEGVMGTSDL